MAKKKIYAAGIASFPKNDPSLAHKMKKRLEEKEIDGVQIISRSDCLEVVVAPFETQQQANEIVAILRERGISGYISTIEAQKPQEDDHATE